MKGGWLVGDFLPTCLKTKECEVACKYYKSGDNEKAHVHKIAIEITVIVSGLVKMNTVEYKCGDIIILEPGDAADFQALEDTTTVVVKIPSVRDDKYFIEK
jgi:quercetin dioxygenase-like cupin family protein